jgi:DNA polymerase-3 subunit gamma/tau
VSLHQVLSNSATLEIANLANKADKEFCQLLYEIAMNAYSKFNVHPDPKEALEICLLRMLTFNPLQKLSESNVPSSDEKKNLKINNLDSNEKSKKVKSIEPEPKINNSEIKNDNDWLIFFDTLEISPFARNYYGNMSFISHTDNKLSLMIDDSTGEVPENIESEFLSTLRQLLDKNIKIHYEKGTTTNSPIETKEKKEKKDLDEAHTKIKNNESIQNFVKKFKGAIKEDTIKPLK